MCKKGNIIFERDGYVKDGLNVGDGDYLEFSYCADCGQMFGNFPLEIEE